MVYFITGTNDSARRNKLYEYMDSMGSQCYLIVPDQFSFESEKMLSDHLRYDKNSNRAEALSFSRICNYIFREYGGLAGEYIDDATKTMIMGAALYKCTDSLSYYGRNIHGTSFISKLLSADSEFKNAGITPESLKNVERSSQGTALSLKAHDLSLIFSEYNKILEKSWVDPLTDISRACDILEKENFFKGKSIFFDSFTGFTAVEYRMISHIIKQAQNVFFSLCSDSLSSNKGNDLFCESCRTAEKITGLCDKYGHKIGMTIKAETENDTRPGAIIDIEHNFLRHGVSPCHVNAGEVELVSASDPYDEANYVACKVRELAESGMRWKDIAITARDLSIYEHALTVAFERLGIPLFLDRNEAVSSHPLSAFISSALSACRSGLDIQNVMRMLKTGILPVSEEDIAEFENYCYIWNIRGRQFAKEFKSSPRGYEEITDSDKIILEQINRVRTLVCIPLSELHKKLSSDDTDGSAFSKALYDFLVSCDVGEGLKNLYDEYISSGNISAAESLDSYWSYVISLLDKFTASLTGISLGENTMTKLFELVLGSARIGILPRTVDCVCAGTADRSRNYSPRAVFVIGCNDGVFPAKPSVTGLFTEKERSEMISLGLEMYGNDNEFILSERMHAFYVFSSASQYLSVSWFRYSHSSELQHESVFISYLKESVSPLATVPTSSLPGNFWLCNDETAFDRLSQFGNESTSESEALKEYFLSQPSWTEKALKMGHAIETSEFDIKSRGVTRELFGTSIRLSPSSIESFESCPFRYYLQYGLRLRERRRAELSPISTGNLIHFVLENIIPKHGGKGLSELSDKELISSIEDIMNEYLDKMMGTAADKTERFKYLFGRIKKFLVKLCRRLGEEFKQSEFEPYGFEVTVGGNGEIPAYWLDVPGMGSVSVIGKIDRIDTFSRNGIKYVRIVDYKTGIKDLRLCDVYYGINIQMLVYLFSIWKNGKGGLSGTTPAGVLYMPAGDGVIKIERDKLNTPDAAATQNKRFAMNGLLLDDETVLNAMEPGLAGIFIPVKTGGRNSSESLASLSELGQIKEHIDSLLIKLFTELSDGKIGAMPYKKGTDTSCDICPYVSVCRRNENSTFKEHVTFKNSEFYNYVKDGEGNV